MTREEIIELAREAGLVLGYSFTWAMLEHFAALVAERVQNECIELVEKELRKK